MLTNNNERNFEANSPDSMRNMLIHVRRISTNLDAKITIDAQYINDIGLNVVFMFILNQIKKMKKKKIST